MVVAPGMGEDGSTVVSVHEYLSLALLPGHTVQFRVATRNDVSRSNFFPTFSCCPNFFFFFLSRNKERKILVGNLVRRVAISPDPPLSFFSRSFSLRVITCQRKIEENRTF